MPLTVLSIAYPFAPTGLDAVGGAEQILSDLDHALVSAGHTSLVVACEGSQAAGKLFAGALPGEVLTDTARRWSTSQFQAAIDRALSSHRVDLIHMHGLDFHEYKLPSSIPVLVTLHLPVAWYSQDLWKQFGSNVQFQCVSETQRLSCPPELRNVLVVENGVELSPLAEKTGNFAIALGRICPEKNMHVALEAGTLANIRVLLGGHVFPYPSHLQYFREKVEPLLGYNGTSTGHAFLGPLASRRKQQLLARAKCLLHPTLAPETSSLVAMEALAAGTPVIAYRSGALPEIVEDGVTGFLVDSAEEMAAAIRNIHAINPETCRATAERRFSRERMVQQYFNLYRKLIESEQPERLYA
jgi:glycosyltransferase involved in cell wall biosynthesis